MATSGNDLVQPTPIPAPRRVWSDAEWDKIRRSSASGDWEATLLGDLLTVAQRSTGRTVYRVRFRRELAGWKIVTAEVEGDAGSYSAGPPDQESQRLVLLVERFAR